MSSVEISTTNPSSGLSLGTSFVHHLVCEKRQAKMPFLGRNSSCEERRKAQETAKPGEKDGSNTSEVEN